MSQRFSIIRVLAIVGAFSFGFAALIGLSLWSISRGNVETGDILVIGRVVGVNTEDKINAYESLYMRDQFHGVTFDVESVKRGTWTQPRVVVLLHSPSMTFGVSKESASGRFALALQTVTINERTVYQLVGESRCFWILPPCG